MILMLFRAYGLTRINIKDLRTDIRLAVVFLLFKAVHLIILINLCFTSR